ncbi:MAG: DUF2017 family protein [Acidimicrobiaceae bacterium]|nr:DUF2017 family protein [Acidimicrobiaceae bacterium]
MSTREIKKIQENKFKVDLHPQVRQILGDLKELTLSHIEDNSPTAQRIFPVAYRNSPEMEMDYQNLTREPLTNHHRDSLAVFEKSLSKPELTEDEVLAWMCALNDMRLILGTALDISEEHATPEENEPNYEGYVVYDLLTYLQGVLIEEIQR